MPLKAPLYHAEGMITPTFTFGTPGDLSVSYAVQSGTWEQIGNTVFFDVQVNFTPTHTTASGVGQVVLTGAPSAAGSVLTTIGPLYSPSAITYPAGVTNVIGSINQANPPTINLFGVGTGTAQSNLSTGAFPTATARILKISGKYKV